MNVHDLHNRSEIGRPRLFTNAFIADSRYRCVFCGSFLSPATVRFYRQRYGVAFTDVALCYACQRRATVPSN